MSTVSKFTKSTEGWGFLILTPALFITAYFLPVILPNYGDMPLCAARHFLGIDCPGCGITRAFVSLAHGNVMGSIHFHPLCIVMSVWLLYMFARALFSLITGKNVPALLSQTGRDILLYSFLAALVLRWGVRLVFFYET